ncbi:MAG: SIMPL domain-containing protein, partial [bacterium]|nr:SIMPL domain-containing protein [bacterium]
LILATAWVGVDMINKIKAGKYIGQGIQLKNTITFTGTGDIYAKPDLAIINFSVVNSAKTVALALDQNQKEMNAVIGSIKGQGVLDKDLKTTNFSIYPQYEYRKEETNIYPYPPGKRMLTGYEVSQSLEVKIRDLDKTGQIIEESAGAGANQIGDLQFVIEKEDELKRQAREQAINEAKAKAKELAALLGVRLVKVTSFSENQVLPRFYGLEKAMAPSGGGVSPQIQTGENKIEVQVSITYEIN